MSSGARVRSLELGATLTVDAVTAEVAGELTKAGVPYLVLRGPSISRWLYLDGRRSRHYSDVDLLVPPAAREGAETVLEQLGFRNRHDRFGAGEAVDHARDWVRDWPRVAIDLHRTIGGAGADPDELFAALVADAEPFDVAGTAVLVPGEPGRTLIVALHAAHHGVEARQSLTDLELALQQVDYGGWRAAAALAGRLDAVAPFSAALRLTPDGAALADRLELPRAVDVVTALRVKSAPSTAIGFARVASMPGLRAKASASARKLVPTRAFMRHWSSLARHGPVGMAAAYVWRPVWLLLHFPRAALEWRRARR